MENNTDIIIKSIQEKSLSIFIPLERARKISSHINSIKC